MTQFKDLSIGDEFDFVKPDSRENSFFLRCEKISVRQYRDSNGNRHTVGTVSCAVYNVVRANKGD